MISMLLAAAWCVPCVSAEAPSKVSPAEANAVWFEHLTFELYRSERDYSQQEKIARKILNIDPVNRPALQILLASHLERGEAVMADVVNRYGQAIGLDTLLIEPLRAEMLLDSLRKRSGEEDVLWDSWYELYQEDFKRFSGQFSPPVFDRMEARIRKYIGRSAEDLNTKLSELARLCEERGEPTVVAMIAHYLNTLEPENIEMLRRAVDAFQRVGLEAAVNGTLKRYAEEEELTVNVAQFLTRECMQQGLHAEVVTYANAWRTLAPENPEPPLLEGRSWIQLNKHEKALGSLLAATKLEGHAPACYLHLATIYGEYGDKGQTLVWLERLRPHLSDEVLIDLLSRQPFARMPNLFLRLDQ